MDVQGSGLEVRWIEVSGGVLLEEVEQWFVPLRLGLRGWWERLVQLQSSRDQGYWGLVWRGGSISVVTDRCSYGSLIGGLFLAASGTWHAEP